MVTARLSARAGACVAVLALLCAAPVPARQKSAPPVKQQAPAARPRPQQQDSTPQKVGIDTSQQLFATMCALWAAGYDSEAATASLPPAWRAVAEQMTQLKGPAVDALRAYYEKHEHQDRSVTRHAVCVLRDGRGASARLQIHAAPR